MGNKEKKGAVKFDLTLVGEQRMAKEFMLSDLNVCTVLEGSAGTGKTTLAINVALTLLFNGKVNKIYVTRPPETLRQFKHESLPGDADEKNALFMIPFFEAIEANYSTHHSKKARIEKAFEKGEIELVPMGYIKGRNLGTRAEPAVIIVDESQSCDAHTMHAILTRVGDGSKIILTYDAVQADHRQNPVGDRLKKLSESVPGVDWITLEENHRSPFVQHVNRVWLEINSMLEKPRERVEVKLSRTQKTIKALFNV